MCGSRASCRPCSTRGRSTPRRRWKSSRRTSATSSSSPGSKRRSSSRRRRSKGPACSSTIQLRALRTTTGSWRRRFCLMARGDKRASMREGPLSDLFRSTTEDAPMDPPEAPRYGRQDPAEAKKEEQQEKPLPAPEPVAEEETSAGVPLRQEEEPSFFDQDADEIETSTEPAPERLKRVFNEEPQPRRQQQSSTETRRYGREEPAY